MSTDLVWVVGGPGDREDLRYSIRSVETNLHLTYRDVWVIGDPPAWFRGARMPLEPLPDKFANQRASITAYVNHPDAAEQFILLNDDMYVTAPITGDLPTFRNKHSLSGWAQVERSERRLNGWHQAVIQTAEWVAERIEGDPPIYECHVPLRFDTRRLRDAINAYPQDRPFAVGEMYSLAGAGPVGEHAGNAKCKGHDTLADKLALPMPFLSGSPETWAGALGEHIRALFPNPSRYEQAMEVAA